MILVDPDERVFKALADATRRSMLDRLRERNGQTLRELCEGLDMTRQAATQHLGLLEAANLISTVRRGREKHHYLNPAPIYEIQHRWIEKFERPRLQALRAIKHHAENAMSEIPSYVYVTYIEATPEKVWTALTDADTTAAYWGHRNVSDWKVGSRWEHQRNDDSRQPDVAGTVLEADAPHRLVCTWTAPDAADEAGATRVTYEIEPFGDIVRLTVTHEDFLDPNDRRLAAHGWPAVLANLKSLLETGRPLSEQPWTMPDREAVADHA